jgi:hypothetical protein
MISPLREFDNITAAGILARAALYLEDKDNPAITNKVPNESLIREAIISHMRDTLGISPNDTSDKALDILGEALDSEGNALLEQTNTDATLERLSSKGELPSDLFDIKIIKNLEQFFGKKFEFEKELIENTIRLPDQEQHYGPPSNPDDPFLISLFSKNFPNKYPKNSFTMLVAGERSGLKLTVHQAWRIYPDSVSLEGVTDLVDMLRRFADKLGSDIEFNGKTGNFFLTEELPDGKDIEYFVILHERKMREEHIYSKKIYHKEAMYSHFTQNNPFGTSKRASLILGIDLVKYRNVLKSHGW